MESILAVTRLVARARVSQLGGPPGRYTGHPLRGNPYTCLLLDSVFAAVVAPSYPA